MREKIAAKIKQMRVSYRKALDSCKQSGGGRVVATFFDLCNQILSGSPATESMSSGLDGAVDSTDAHSHSFESSTENTTFQNNEKASFNPNPFQYQQVNHYQAPYHQQTESSTQSFADVGKVNHYQDPYHQHNQSVNSATSSGNNS